MIAGDMMSPMRTQKVVTINAGPRVPDWGAATAAMRRGESTAQVMRALLGVDPALTGEALDTAVMEALAEQRPPELSIYDRAYTAHIYPTPGVSHGQVFDALRDYASQHASDDPAMREVKRRKLLELLDQWQAEGPPSAEDDRVWREFDADLARARRGEFTVAAEEMRERAEHAEALNRELTGKIRDLLWVYEGADNVPDWVENLRKVLP
jgi:hypothetical protein